jgi:hypothetical protein
MAQQRRDEGACDHIYLDPSSTIRSIRRQDGSLLGDRFGNILPVECFELLDAHPTQLVDNMQRRPSRYRQSAPEQILRVGIAGFCDGRHAWQERNSFRRTDRKRGDLSVRDNRERHDQRDEVVVDAPCHDFDESLGSTEWDMSDADPSGYLQSLGGHVRQSQNLLTQT